MILFNSRTPEYSWLSNFYRHPIVYNGLTYGSAEASYQASKCSNPVDKFKFINVNPLEAKRRGRLIEIREDWEDIKVKVMGEIIREKFQYPNLRDKLLETADIALVHLAPWDLFWGCDKNGMGKNILGKIIMERRDWLKSK